MVKISEALLKIKFFSVWSLKYTSIPTTDILKDFIFLIIYGRRSHTVYGYSKRPSEFVTGCRPIDHANIT